MRTRRLVRRDLLLATRVRRRIIARSLLDAEKAALFIAVEGIHRVIQPGTLDEPRLELFIYVENQHQVLGLKVAAYGRVVADTGTKNWCACEVDDISTARVVDVPEFIPERLGR